MIPKPDIRQRKLQHLQLFSQDPHIERNGMWFDHIQLRHRALPEIDWDEVDTSCVFLGKKLAFPFLISSMTGGGGEQTRKINENLARAAETCQIAFATGSQRIMFETPAAESCFRLRQWAPATLVFANLGAIQLNNGLGMNECRKAIEITGADGLFFHLNPLQEAIQPEGQLNFKGLAQKIGHIAANLEKPVLVKEVGAGIGIDDARLLLRHNIRIIDVAGRGGTSWSRVEHHRRNPLYHDDLGLIFQDWGLPTPQALIQLLPLRHQIDVIASGGIRNGIDMIKAIILGARLCGAAAPLLDAACQSTEAVIEIIRKWQHQFRVAMFLLGARTVEELRFNFELLLTLPTQESPSVNQHNRRY